MKKGIINILAVCLVLVLAGFGCQKSPEKVVEGAKVKLAAQESMSYKLNISADAQAFQDGKNTALQGVSPGVDHVILVFTGNIDRSGDNVADNQTTFDVELDGEDSMSISGEFRTVGDTSFVKLSQLSSGEDMGGLDLSQLIDTWISFSTIKGLAEMEDEEGDPLTAQQVKALEKAFADFSLFSDAKEVGSEEMHGAKTTKYEVTFDKDGIIGFVEEVSEITEEEFGDEERDDLSEAVDFLNAGKTYLWIGDKDGLLYKIDSSPVVLDESGQAQEVSLTLELFDFGKTVNIEAPSDAKSFEEAMGVLFGGMFGDMEGGGEDDFGGMFGGSMPMMEDFNGMGDFDFSELEKIMEGFGE